MSKSLQKSYRFEKALMILTSNVLILISLSGCGVYRQTFDCPPGKGVGCRSISEVNEMVDKDILEEEINGKSKKKISSSTVSRDKLPCFGSFNDTNNISNTNNVSTNNVSKTNNTSVYRLPEETLKVWIAPYEDKEGDFIEETYVYTVVTPGRWVEN